MKNIMKKISNVLRIMFGYGITICLFLGGLTFLGYVVALVVGGEKASLLRTEIVKAVQALFDVESHKVVVIKMKEA